ncbi:uncharacterized protein LOC131317811 isoform X2 [Rhododendron vialii]|uniref:uncharacterized protein LOC131317811 isoform X2 n=2 Tax=Rhododendron vialii TaxID=182163 RepID=UPI00265FE8FB|nr:uncharacterized protein LOC131317811 isoform X2 [Rhododendron vialii]
MRPPLGFSSGPTLRVSVYMHRVSMVVGFDIVDCLSGVCQEVPKMSDILGNILNDTVNESELITAGEMEKKRIREEIRTLGLSRRREIEAEVVREMIMEGELEAEVVSDILGNALDERELMVAEEMEKKRIREEIKASGLSRRRELETEVAREMTMEGVFDRGSDLVGLSLKDYGHLGVGFGKRIQKQGENDGRSSVVETKDSILLGAFPFQRDPEAVLKGRMPIPEPIKEAKHFPSVNLFKKLRKEWSCSLCQFNATSEHRLNDHLQGRKHKAKEKAKAETTKPVNKNADNSEASVEEAEYSNEVGMNLAKPLDSSVSGVKRKSEAPITEFVNDTPSVNLSKKLQKLWSCSLCKVAVTCELDLSCHLHGKIHNAKEKAIAETTKPLNKNADNSEALVEEAENSDEQEMNDVDSVDCELKLKGELKNTNDGAEVSENEIATDQNNDFKFRCNICKFGTNAEEEMTDHRRELCYVTLWEFKTSRGKCELDLKRHLQGRTHKAKEKAIAETTEQKCELDLKRHLQLSHLIFTHFSGLVVSANAFSFAYKEKEGCTKRRKRQYEKPLNPLNKNADNSEALVEEAEYSDEQEMNDVDSGDCGLKLKGELKKDAQSEGIVT